MFTTTPLFLSVPPVATLAIAGVILLIFIICCCCCCCKLSTCCKKTENEEDKEEQEEVDFQTIELMELPEHERTQPSTDEMDYSVAGYIDDEDVEGTVLG